MRKLLVCSVLAATMLVPAGFGAGKDDKAQNHSDAFIPGPATENKIAKEIRHQLLTLPYYGVFDDLGFMLQGGVVTLVGEVTWPALKSDAENVVEHVEGVTQVINQIEVLPPSTMDDQIRRAEYRVIYGDPTLSTRYGFHAIPPIHIIVKNGHVRLEGVAANQADKNLIGVRANSVPNVFSVQNDLRVEGS
jgi:hyperosmotically inducible protein